MKAEMRLRRQIAIYACQMSLGISQGTRHSRTELGWVVSAIEVLDGDYDRRDLLTMWKMYHDTKETGAKQLFLSALKLQMEQNDEI